MMDYWNLKDKGDNFLRTVAQHSPSYAELHARISEFLNLEVHIAAHFDTLTKHAWSSTQVLTLHNFPSIRLLLRVTSLKSYTLTCRENCLKKSYSYSWRTHCKTLVPSLSTEVHDTLFCVFEDWSKRRIKAKLNFVLLKFFVPPMQIIHREKV